MTTMKKLKIKGFLNTVTSKLGKKAEESESEAGLTWMCKKITKTVVLFSE